MRSRSAGTTPDTPACVSGCLKQSGEARCQNGGLDDGPQAAADPGGETQVLRRPLMFSQMETILAMFRKQQRVSVGQEMGPKTKRAGANSRM